MSETDSKILILGLGNDVLTDDAAGLKVVRQLRESLPNADFIEVRETMEMGLALLDFMVGYRAVVIVDAIQTGRVPPGTAHELDAAELRQFTGRTPHFLGVGETLALGRRLGLPMPDLVKILAIEVEDPFTLGTELTPTLRQAIPGLVDRLSRLVNSVAAVHRVAVVQTQFFAAERRNSARVDSI